ncbi:SdrD B-like domain-containing protein [Candidatus Thiothrix sp. Deng01]|uniref:SdrD B-like domain-containing protein n=1 Tax=Candidatus Thiothrix phosphatis TaxID=3112415 RepID=A0ABU6CSY4_9GAMM|nr:SdrD B-like domain-containing protein [Candidatus Thiothrix sp. Deng01]MEB4589936.1 SdrD B-like domain-containing protein [Candidatus Thiothrix sp. Deng01]
MQFVKDGAVNVDFALMNPADYSQQAPDVVTTMSVLGPTDTVTAPGKDFRNLVNLVKFPYAAEGYPGSAGYIAPTALARHQDIGSTFGLAYDRNTGSVFASAFYKRGSGFGPGGPGAIYRVSQGGAISVQATIPNVGSTAHSFSAVAPYDQFDYDLDAKTAIGKESLGDIDISPDGQWLYVVNLFDRHLYQVSTTTANQVTDLGAITRPADCVSDLDFRPFALAFNDANELYVGAVCSNESGLESGGQPAALVLKRETAGSFSRVFGFGLQFGDVQDDPQKPYWGSWAIWASWENGYVPLFSDLFFYGKDMVMGFRNVSLDRFYFPAASSPPIGELLKACWTGTDWQLENNAVCGGATGALPNFNATNPQHVDTGPGGGNFFDFTDAYGDQGFQGGLAHVPGHTSFLHTSSDPYQATAGGMFRADILTGQKSQAYEVYHGSATNTFTDYTLLTPAIDGYFGKSNGMGDLEVLSDPAPIEIGNRVWLDSDGDGIQDAGEAGIPGVEVKLLAADGVTELATATTAADGTYYFSSAAGTSTSSTIYGVSALQPGTAYTLKFPTAVTVSGAAYKPTTVTVGGNREIDSNASSAGLVPITTLDIPVAGANNHSFDVGYAEVKVDVALTKTVGPAAAKRGETVVYTLTVTNTGEGVASGVKVVDKLPAGLTFVSHDGATPDVYDAVTGEWDVGTVGVGAANAVSLGITATVQ